MEDLVKAKDYFRDSISSINDIDSKEKYLRRVINSGAFDGASWADIRDFPEVQRHLGLVHIIDWYLENLEFQKSNEKAKKESPLMVLMALPVLPPF